MTRKELIKNDAFEEISEVRVDSKNRITLGRGVVKVSSYKIYRNSLGQYVLDPQVTVPAYESWIYKNPQAKELVRKGLADLKSGRCVKAKEDYSKYAE